MKRKFMPKVSIRLMTYNSGKFIAETIESCLNQTFQNFEICIADDASTDDTTAIIQEYQTKFPDKIKLFIQPVNMGQYAVSINGNTSRKMCTGEYVALLDGDDIMLPNRLEEQVKFLDHHQEYIAVTHDCETFNSDTGEIYPDFFSWINTKNRSTSYLIKHGNQVHTPTVMHRNFPDNVLLANTSIKKMADWYFFIELSMKGKIGHQDIILTRYRRHNNNLTNTNFFEDRLITLALIENKYPKFLKEVQEARIGIYLSKAKENKKYLLNVITTFPFLIIIIQVFNRIIKKLTILKTIRYLLIYLFCLIIQTQIAYSATMNIETTGAIGDGIHDDTAAIQTAFDSGVDTIDFRAGRTYLISSTIYLNRGVVQINGNKSVIKLAKDFKGTDDLIGWDLSGDNVTIDNIVFDGVDAKGKAKKNFFIKIEKGNNIQISNSIFRNLNYGTGPRAAIAFLSAPHSGHHKIDSCSFYDCPGSVFTQVPYTYISNCLSVSPHDASYAINGPNANYCTVTNCKVDNSMGNSVSSHIAVEQGSNNFTITNNTVLGIETGFGIGAINVSGLMGSTFRGTGGTIENNMIDGMNLDKDVPKGGIVVHQLYSGITVKNNMIKNILGAANSSYLWIGTNGHRIIGNTIINTSAVIHQNILITASQSNPGTLLLENASMTEGRNAIVMIGNNQYNPIILRNVSISNIKDGLVYSSLHDTPVYLYDCKFNNVFNPVDGGKNSPWGKYFNNNKAWEHPYSIDTKVSIYGKEPPSNGMWKKGDTIYNPDSANSGIIKWICIESGEPGIWQVLINGK